MLNDATCFKNVYIVCGFTDLRKGIDSLAAIIAERSELKPFVPDTLYLFCGRRHNKIRLEKDYGFKPRVDIRTGLRKFCEWYEIYNQKLP